MDADADFPVQRLWPAGLARLGLLDQLCRRCSRQIEYPMRYDRASLRRRIADFCCTRISRIYPPRDVEALQAYLFALIAEARQPTRVDEGFDWAAIATALGIETDRVNENAEVLRPAFTAVSNGIPKRRPVTPKAAPPPKAPVTRTASEPDAANDATEVSPVLRRRRGRRPAPIVEFPEPD